MVNPPRENLGQRAVGAAAALIVAGALCSTSIIFHSRTLSAALDTIVPLIVGLVVGVGLFLRWRHFWFVACAYVGIATIIHIIAVIPHAMPFDGLLPVVAPRLVIDALIFLLLLLPPTRSYYFTQTI
jgi:hypothetical protein